MWLWVLLGIGGAAWLALSEVRWFLSWNARVAELAADGKWGALIQQHEKGLKSMRPFMLLLRKVLMPGSLELQYALHLHMMGWSERALPLANQVVDLVDGKSRWLAPALATRAVVLGAMGRLEEAELDYAHLLTLDEIPPGLLGFGAQLSLWRGQWDEALQRAELATTKEPNDEAAQLCASCALMELGRFEDAVRTTEYEPRRLAEILSPSDVARLEDDDAGQRMLAAQERERAQVARPAPFLQAAAAYVEAGDARAAEAYLARVGSVLGRNPVIVTNFHLIRALCRAMDKDHASAEQAITDARALLDEMPYHLSLRSELMTTEARCLLLAQRPDEALRALDSAEQDAKTPAGQHQVLYWRAMALEQAGRIHEAQREFARVVAENIAGFRHDNAQKAVERIGNKGHA